MIQRRIEQYGAVYCLQQRKSSQFSWTERFTYLIGWVRSAVFRSSTTLFLISISSSSKANRVCICRNGEKLNENGVQCGDNWLKWLNLASYHAIWKATWLQTMLQFYATCYHYIKYFHLFYWFNMKMLIIIWQQLNSNSTYFLSFTHQCVNFRYHDRQ